MQVPAWAAQALIQAGARCDRHGWVPGTAGNFSVRLDKAHCAVTQSGRHKGFLGPQDVMAMGIDGTAAGPGRPSYETPLHLALYARDPAIGAVVHGHSVAATVLSRAAGTEIRFSDYELQKVLPGAPDPGAQLALPVFDNDQDIPRLAARIDQALDPATAPGYLLRGHGVYVWGAGMDQALARLEALEFILACELEQFRRDR